MGVFSFDLVADPEPKPEPAIISSKFQGSHSLIMASLTRSSLFRRLSITKKFIWLWLMAKTRHALSAEN